MSAEVLAAERFDPVQLARETEKIIINGDRRKYNTFRVENFYGRSATARGVGCNLRCCFCWINPSRDRPQDYGAFYSPEEAYNMLVEATSRLKEEAPVKLVRISGCEPTIGKEHLLSFIELCKGKKYFSGFLLETNGILLGHSEDFVRELKGFGDYLTVRLSFKAGTPEAFQKKTGASAEFFELPFNALAYLQKHGISYILAAMSKDPFIMPPDERVSLLERIAKFGNRRLIGLEEEKADPFGITIKRLVEKGIVSDSRNIGKLAYAPLHVSLEWAMQKRGQTHRIKSFEAFTKLDAEELRKVLSMIKLFGDDGKCGNCTGGSPWCGHDAEDDLDARLGLA